MNQDNEWFSRGFDSGNYGNAYESRDWETWYAEHCIPPNDCTDTDAYQDGMLLGFFSSYEISEISDEIIADTVAVLRAKWGAD